MNKNVKNESNILTLIGLKIKNDIDISSEEWEKALIECRPDESRLRKPKTRYICSYEEAWNIMIQFMEELIQIPDKEGMNAKLIDIEDIYYHIYQFDQFNEEPNDDEEKLMERVENGIEQMMYNPAFEEIGKSKNMLEDVIIYLKSMLPNIAISFEYSLAISNIINLIGLQLQ